MMVRLAGIIGWVLAAAYSAAIWRALSSDDFYDIASLALGTGGFLLIAVAILAAANSRKAS